MAALVSHTTAHESATTVAPFRAWRGLQRIAARGPMWVTSRNVNRINWLSPQKLSPIHREELKSIEQNGISLVDSELVGFKRKR